MSATPEADPDATRRDRILQAAIAEFSEKGLAGVRVDEVAKRAGCNKALIYYYFESKDGLYDAVFAHLVDNSRPFWSRISERQFGDWLAELGPPSDDPGTSLAFMRLMTMEGLADTGGAVIRERERAASLAHSVELIRKSQRDGEVADDLDPELLALLVVGWSLTPYILPQVTRMLTGLSPTDAEFRRRTDALNQRLAVLARPRRRDE